MNFNVFMEECKLITKRRQVQAQFMKEKKSSSWEEATKEYPRQITSAAIDSIIGFNYKRSQPDVCGTT